MDDGSVYSHVYVFGNRQRDCIKMLLWDSNGF
ncbi:IS66 family insertion sequence element accessory protein TnpB [Paraburkholderia sediminicola]